MKQGVKRGMYWRLTVIKWLTVLITVFIFSIFPLKTMGNLVAPAASSLSDTQRNARDSVLGVGDVLCGQAMEISRSPDYRMDQIQQIFDDLRAAYVNFKATLIPKQLSYAAEQIADLDAGLEIINQLFTSNQEQAALGQASRGNMLQTTRVLNDAVRVWCDKFKFDCDTKMQIW